MSDSVSEQPNKPQLKSEQARRFPISDIEASTGAGGSARPPRKPPETTFKQPESPDLYNVLQRAEEADAREADYVDFLKNKYGATNDEEFKMMILRNHFTPEEHARLTELYKAVLAVDKQLIEYDAMLSGGRSQGLSDLVQTAKGAPEAATKPTTQADEEKEVEQTVEHAVPAEPVVTPETPEQEKTKRGNDKFLIKNLLATICFWNKRGRGRDF